MKKFAVFGNPIAHSLSPAIHQMFAESTNERIQYEKIAAPVDAFEETITAFFADELVVGCNVTVPFKERAYKVSESNCNEEATLAKAVNTLHKKDGELYGYTTDGIGLVADLLSSVTTLQGKRVLLIGAGGATRGVVAPLIKQDIAELYITNRTVEKAKAIVSDIAHPRFHALDAEEVAGVSPDIIINCTSASLTGELPPVCAANFKHCHLAYDMVYSNKDTSFMRYAQENGATHTKDGFGMLVEQAAAAFSIWTGKTPDTSAVIDKLRPR